MKGLLFAVTTIAVLSAQSAFGLGGRIPPIGGGTGTGGSGNPPATSAVDNVDSYLQRFKTLGNTYGASFVNENVSFSYGALIGPAIGLCVYSSAGGRVSFQRGVWQNGSDTFREMLSFHELGHCMLGRKHKNSKYSDGRPESLMSSWMMDEGIYTANRDAYLKELFTAENNRFTNFSAGLKAVEACKYSR